MDQNQTKCQTDFQKISWFYPHKRYCNIQSYRPVVCAKSKYCNLSCVPRESPNSTTHNPLHTATTTYNILQTLRHKYTIPQTTSDLIRLFLSYIISIPWENLNNMGQAGFQWISQFSQHVSNLWLNPILQTAIKFASIVVLIVIAFFLAGLVKTLIIKLFRRFAIDNKISKLLWANIELTDVASMLGYYLIILFFLPGILQSIWLGQMVAPIQNVINSIVWFIPQLISATIIGIIFYIVAKVIWDIVSKFVTSVDLPALLSKIGITDITLNIEQISRVIKGSIVALVLLIWSSQIFWLLGLNEVGMLVTNVISGIGSIILWGAIIWLGLYLGNIIAEFVSLSASKSSKMLSMICKYGIIIFAVLIWLDKMGVPSNLINLLVMIVLGSLGLGFALAIWLWAKESIWSEVKDLIHNLKK
jgi:hypothetical protein